MNRAYCSLFVLVLAALAHLAGCDTFSATNEERGDRYYSEGHYDDSLAEYLMARKTGGMTTRLLRKIGRVYVKKGDFLQAKNYYDQYFKATDAEPDPGVLLDYFQIAVKRGEAGDMATMVQALEEILEIDGSYSLGRYFFDLGEYYFQQSDFTKAIVYFLRGLPLKVEVGNREVYLFHLAQSYEKLEDYFNAYLYFDQFLTLFPESPMKEQALWHRGNCCYPLARQLNDQGQYDQALFYLELIITQGQPQHYIDDACFLKGEILLALNRPDEARSSYQRVLKLNRYYYKEKVAEQARARIHEIELKKRLSH
ncbi:MAG: tetratricopeptide repeat protein [Gemmatimonadota bacterium]|nr:tetratricopeptide repeat protein [Gemmatimonadota bacterium]